MHLSVYYMKAQAPSRSGKLSLFELATLSGDYPNRFFIFDFCFSGSVSFLGVSFSGL